MSLSTFEHLHHMLDETDYLIRHAKGLTKDEFKNDETLRRAFVLSIEIIGEATKQLSPETGDRPENVSPSNLRTIAFIKLKTIE
jgi:uncharacterized protein with HEPN domain